MWASLVVWLKMRIQTIMTPSFEHGNLEFIMKLKFAGKIEVEFYR